MVVDEAHHAAVKHGAHDAFANDFRWSTAEGVPKYGVYRKECTPVLGEWLEHDNLVTLLVSATPACVLTADSRLPRQYYVPEPLTAKQKGLEGTQHLRRFSVIQRDIPKGAPFKTRKLADTNWLSGGQQIQAAHLQRLIDKQVSSASNLDMFFWLHNAP